MTGQEFAQSNPSVEMLIDACEKGLINNIYIAKAYGHYASDVKVFNARKLVQFRAEFNRQMAEPRIFNGSPTFAFSWYDGQIWAYAGLYGGEWGHQNESYIDIDDPQLDHSQLDEDGDDNASYWSLQPAFNDYFRG